MNSIIPFEYSSDLSSVLSSEDLVSVNSYDLFYEYSSPVSSSLGNELIYKKERIHNVLFDDDDEKEEEKRDRKDKIFTNIEIIQICMLKMIFDEIK